MVGLVAKHGPSAGMPIKKASTMTASHECLVEPFVACQCDGSHEHLRMDGESENLKACQVWTWDEANRVVAGIVALKRHLTQESYPVRRKLRSDSGENSEALRKRPRSWTGDSSGSSHVPNVSGKPTGVHGIHWTSYAKVDRLRKRHRRNIPSEDQMLYHKEAAKADRRT